MSDYDVIVIRSGAGGGTIAHRLAPSAKRIPQLGGQQAETPVAVLAESRRSPAS